MKLIYYPSSLPDFTSGMVAAIGNFDGVHLGHQALLKTLVNKAKKLDLPTVVILFEPQPCEYFQNLATPRLSSLREKLHDLKQCDVDYVYCLKFNKSLALMSAQDFANVFLYKLLNIKYLLIGRDFKFGYNRLGDVGLLQKLAFFWNAKVEVLPDFLVHGNRISSTKVRYDLKIGDLAAVQDALGHPFWLCGRVIKGEGRGSKWGIPTANLNLRRTFVPLSGVFCVKVLKGNQEFYGVANIGTRPTVDGTTTILEVHLFDLNESLYGTRLAVYFMHKLRDEIKFSSVDKLIIQIKEDIEAAKSYFATTEIL